MSDNIVCCVSECVHEAEVEVERRGSSLWVCGEHWRAFFGPAVKRRPLRPSGDPLGIRDVTLGGDEPGLAAEVKYLNLKRKKCKRCGGTGVCRTCGGEYHGPHCDICGGSGHCPDCGGSGEKKPCDIASHYHGGTGRLLLDGECVRCTRAERDALQAELKESQDSAVAWEVTALQAGGDCKRLRAERDRLKDACILMDYEVQQTLGRALGYPKIMDDQKNFPGATEEDGVCVGEHVALTIAEEAAGEIARLQARVGELEGAIKGIPELRVNVLDCDTGKRHLECQYCRQNDDTDWGVVWAAKGSSHKVRGHYSDCPFALARAKLRKEAEGE